MSMPIVVFDVDGVLMVHTEPFSWKYARERGLDRAEFKKFFQGDFQEALVGKADLKELIKNNHDLWQWDKPIEELLDLWFHTENVPNDELFALVSKLRTAHIPCYYATNQDKYRGEYLRSQPLKNLFDGEFVSAEMGIKKPDIEFFNYVFADISKQHGPIEPKDVIFIDDTETHIKSAKQFGFSAYLYNPETKNDIIQHLHTLITSS